jgi:hypothetical protein
MATTPKTVAAWRRHLVDHPLTLRAVDQDGSTPGFAHTIGLSSVKRPELLIVGCPPGVALRLLDAASRNLLDHTDADINHPPEIQGVLFTYLLVPDDVVVRHMSMLVGLYTDPRVWQVWWHDADARFPGDEGFNAGPAQTLSAGP